MERDFIITAQDTKITAPIVLAKLTKLCEISGGFITDNNSNDILMGTHKLDALSDLLIQFRENGIERVVIYSRFLWEINRIKETIGRLWQVYQISGEISQAERVLAEKLFN